MVRELPGAAARACETRGRKDTVRVLPAAGAGAVRGPAPGTSRVRARRGEERDTVRDLLAAGALLAGLSGHSAANRRQVRETLEKPRSRAQLFGRFCAWGTRRGFCPAGFLPAAGNRRWAFSLPGKTGARRGPAPGTSRVRARHGEEKDTVREWPGAAARACETRGRKRHGARIARRRRRSRAWNLHPEPAAGMRGWAETQTWCANCPAQPRVRARHGEEKDTVRVLLAAGAGFLPARENRSRAWACTQKEPRACAVQMQNTNTVRELLGAAARLAHRRCRSPAWACTRNQPRACEAGQRYKHGA